MRVNRRARNLCVCAHIECEVGSLYIESQMVESLKQMPFSTSIIIETSPELEKKKKTKRDVHTTIFYEMMGF
jgi:hypothetical protein